MRQHVVDWLSGYVPYEVAATIAPTWFTCVGMAGLVTLLVMMFVARRRGADPYVIASCVLWCYVAAVAAGIVVPMTIDAAEQLVTTGSARLRWAGMTSFWGYLAGGVAVAVVCRRHGLSLARMGDLSAAPLGLALAFARVGCFLGGCDYGKVTSVPWAMRFPSGSPAWQDHVRAGLVPASRGESLPVHPTQLYEALLGLGIAVVVLVLSRRDARSRAARWMQARDGRAFVLAAAVYSCVRIGIESLRGDAGRGIHGGLSSGQIFSIAVLAVIAAGALLGRVRAHRLAARPALAGAVTVALVLAVAGDADADPATPPPQRDDHAAVGLLVGVAVPINRRPEQVATLGGPSLSLGYTFGRAGVWLDLESLGNADASHGTVLVSGSFVSPVARNLMIGARAGFGTTLVNFDEPAFRDVMGPTLRAEAIADLQIADSLLLWVRPLSFDVLTASGLGGPITTWQMRIGLAYKIGGAKKVPRASPPPPPSPPAPPPPPPPAQQQPPPGTERGTCRPDGTCDPGLTCASNRCVVLPQEYR
ncbi:MAG: prolipoprotein diacylglyceryl transferase [Deltaproteobacteria bacterium]|nr:prolipoprotein diacylglyceryl transferase [Deltaproteobacteria bacterium]